MDVQGLISQHGFSGIPVGVGVSPAAGPPVCDVFVFDGGDEPEQAVPLDGGLARIRHASLSETRSRSLLEYDGLRIVQDESWELHMLLSRIGQRRGQLFEDSAKNSLIESLFCCQKAADGVSSSDAFAPCWQKCASYHLADAVSLLNRQVPGPLMLGPLRRLAKSPVNEHISVVTQTAGIERATPVLLGRMAKSAAGFAEMAGRGGSSRIIQETHDALVRDSMLSDCYFYLGHVSRDNFAGVGDPGRRPDLIHVLKIAFDIEADPGLLSRHAELVRKSCRDLLDLASRG